MHPQATRTGIEHMTDIELNGIKTRTSRYVAHDGREMAVLLMEDYRRLLKMVKHSSSLDGLKYALSVLDSRRVLNRAPAYLAACDEMKIFLEAAIERVEHGESMCSTAVTQ